MRRAGSSPLHEHGHNDVDVAVVPDGTNDSGARRARRLERHFADIIQRLQDVLQVATVEGDLRSLALNLDVDVALVLTDLLRTRRDRHLARVLAFARFKLDAHDARAIARENCGDARLL